MYSQYTISHYRYSISLSSLRSEHAKLTEVLLFTLRAVQLGFDLRQRQFSLRYRIQTGCGSHKASYPVGTVRFPRR